MKYNKIILIGSLLAVFATFLWKLGLLEEPTTALFTTILTAITSFWVYLNKKESESENFNIENETNKDMNKKTHYKQDIPKTSQNNVTIKNTNLETKNGDINIVGGHQIKK